MIDLSVDHFAAIAETTTPSTEQIAWLIAELGRMRECYGTGRCVCGAPAYRDPPDPFSPYGAPVVKTHPCAGVPK